MARPHPVLLDVVARRPVRDVSDPERLLASAEEHRCEGLLWSAVQSGEIELPVELLHRLAQRDLEVQAHQRRLMLGLETVLRAAQDVGVAVVMAKGLATQARWYDRMGERPCNDLDLVIDTRDPAAVVAFVHALHPDHVFAAEVEDFVATDAVQAIDLLLPGDIEVDVHLDLLKMEIPMRSRDLVFSRSETVSLAEGLQVQALDSEMSLLHLLIHLNKDRFSQLLAFADIGRLLESDSVDWTEFRELVTAEGLMVPVERSLRVVTDTLGTPEMPDFGGVGGWRGRVWDHLWSAHLRLLGDEGLSGWTRRQYFLPWLATGRVRETCRWFVRRRVFPPRPYVDFYYRDVPGPYPVRLVRGRLAKRRRLRDEPACS